MNLATNLVKVRRLVWLIVLFIVYSSQYNLVESQQQQQRPPQTSPNEQLEPRLKPTAHVPSPLQSASYISLDGLTLVIVFDKPVNLSASIESVEQRLAAASSAFDETSSTDDESSQGHVASESAPSATSGRLVAHRPCSQGQSSSVSDKLKPQDDGKCLRKPKHRRRAKVTFSSSSRKIKATRSSRHTNDLLLAAAASSAATCQLDEDTLGAGQQLTPHVIGGIQLCAQLLTRKSLKLLHKFHPHNCLWASQIQFLIQLRKPIKLTSANAAQQSLGPQTIKIAFKRGTLSEQGQWGARWNEQDTSIELAKLPLEGLGVPLAPRLALTGPNQVPPCGHFSLSAHLSSPYGTQPEDSVKLQWFVERIGLSPTTLNNSNSQANQSEASVEFRWLSLKQLVARQRSNNLVLDAQLLEFAPQLYEFRLQVSFATSLTSFTLNATHRIARLELEAPIGTLYGTHLLSLDQQLNTNQDLALLADIQVPECAQNIKQVGLYWQVSDPRVRFEQTYAPLYLAKAGSLPEQALIEFRLNLFYGIRVRKFAFASALVPTGDSVLEAQISDGLLMTSLTSGLKDSLRPGQQFEESQLELFAISREEPRELQEHKYTFQWSCFDGKTAQPCQKSLRVQGATGGGVGNTRYDVAENQSGRQRASQLLQARPQLQQNEQNLNNNQATSLLLVDRSRQRQSILRLPLSWFEADAQLWFGLQRFDRQQPSQHSKTEYALVNVQPPSSGAGGSTSNLMVVAIGPVLIGRARQRASLRNPLTGAILALANTQTIIVGRLSGGAINLHANNSNALESSGNNFKWHIPNYLHPLHWTSKSVINSLNGQRELVTELHLGADLLLAHAHYQIQLSVCADAQTTSVASISLDVVQGVSQCRVELQGAAAVAQSAPTTPTTTMNNLPLVISVNHCNIPLGLSPLTYQLYAIDTSAADAFVESSKPTTGSSDNTEDEHSNEADELHYESQAQPLSVPQLSPVFALGNLNALALMELIQQPEAGGSESQTPLARLRFGARVCNRLQSCQMFYSNSLDPMLLLAQDGSQPSGSSAQNRSSLATLQLQQDGGGTQAVKALANVLEGARRANLAGNSVAAISLLNALMALGQRLLERQANAIGQRTLSPAPARRQNYRQASGEDSSTSPTAESAAQPTGQRAPLNQQQLDRLRDLLQVAMRDCVAFGAQSIQRQFHYTEPGQTSVALLAMGRLLRLASDEQWELRYRAMRLMALLVRKSIEQSLDQRQLTSLPDFKSIQAAYESLFSTFGQHSLDAAITASTAAASTSPLISNKHLAKRHDRAERENDQFSSVQYAANSSSSSEQLAPEPSSASASVSLRPSATGRRKREEAVLAYLRLVRHAHKALLQATAAQLPLGGVQQFEYDSRQHASEPLAQLLKATDTGTSGDKLEFQRQQQQPSASIVSSLAHQTDLQSDTIDVDLREFGAVSVRLVSNTGAGDNSNVLGRLAQRLSQSHVRCRNDSAQTKCSSFVLALTSFAGKAPFRSLDSIASGASASAASGRVALLRVPVVQIDWLSPLDGSSLTDMLRQDQATNSAGGAAPTLADFKAVVTFTLPPTGDNLATAGSDSSKFRCYQFAETANEWVEVEQQQQQQPQASSEEEEARQRTIRCTFDGFGVVGAFQGRPPPIETSVETKIALAIGACLILVTILSLFGCLASNWKAEQRRQRADAKLRQEHNKHHLANDELNPTVSTSSSRSNVSSSYESDYTTTRTRAR